MNKTLLELKKLDLSRNDKKIISEMSLCVYDFSVINIFGQNGSGKTSLLKMLVGITEPTSGEIINNIDSLELQSFAYVGHKYGIKKNLTLSENLVYGDSEKMTDQNKIDEIIARYEMLDFKDYLIKDLSHGQQKKVSLMKASISDAKVWIIDEPYSALDKNAVKILDESIYKHIAEKGSVIMTNHEPIINKSFKITNVDINR